jgi:hypothetical protein
LVVKCLGLLVLRLALPLGQRLALLRLERLVLLPELPLAPRLVLLRATSL